MRLTLSIALLALLPGVLPELAPARAAGVPPPAGTPPAGAPMSEPSPFAAQAEAFAAQSAQAMLGTGMPARMEIEVGSLDPRLKLAPCERIEPYLPAGARAWGRTRIGLRCVQGARWNVALPVTVRVFAPALVAAQPLRAGTVLDATHLRSGEVDLAGADSPAVVDLSRVLGRPLARPLAPGQALHDNDLKKRQVFAVGDAVRVVAAGPGFAVSGEAVALTPGFEGQPVRLRSESGRTIHGVAVGERRAQVQP
jgi:flagella basal body P-ring formation protein FlgA